jgi:uncharacterized membrane protein SpoIIM required for sporulation
MATNVDRFVREREERWTELEGLIAAAKSKPERLGPARVLRLGELYRATVGDLANARRTLRGEPVVARLESLVGRARGLVYDSEARRESIREFFTTGYWRRLWSHPGTLAVAAAVMFVPAVLAFVWAARDPAAAVGVVPQAFRGIGDGSRTAKSAGLTTGDSSAFASEIMTNNIRVTVLAFAGGITFGVGTIAVLIFNGVLLGAVGGLSFHAARGHDFVTLVVAHGILELSCITVAGAAGLRMAAALVAPGRSTRAVALARGAREAVELVLGTAPWLVVAGLIEGFITPAGYGLAVNATIGIVVGGTFWFLVWRRGARGAPEPSG